MASTDIEIITYGGGDLLWQIFNALSMLFYGKGSSSSAIQPLCVISSMIGGAWGISRCFFQAYTDAFLTKYFLPLLAVPYMLIVPQTTVHIIDKLDASDKLNGKPLVVDHVPLLFANIAGMTSFWGHKLTQSIENVMHTPNDVMYSKTGKIFGAETALDFTKLKLTNATMAQNIQQFTQQCVIYDIALNRYTLDELRKSSDLLSFLKEKTSNVRMIPYVDPVSKEMNYVTCSGSIEKMSALFDKEVEYYTKHEVLKNLPIAYQALMDFKKKAEDRVSGQMSHALMGDEKDACKKIITVNSFNDAAARFATERAKDNQRSIYQTAGSLAGSSLVNMRIIFEALIYASFAIILPLSLMPGGIKFIGSWIFLNVWIQLWPPLYAIINYITMVCAQKYAQSIMGGISDGYSLFTSAGLQDMAQDTAALGGFLSLSVPLISFYLLQNLQSMVHLTGSLMTPAHSSAQTGASELSTGNYSFANSSMGQISYDNQTSFQQNSAPSLSTGYFTDNHGTHQIKYGREILTVNQDPSHLNTSISTAEAYSHSLQNAQQHAQTQVDSTQESYMKSISQAERSAADMIQHISSGTSYSHGYSNSETQATQESANYVKNAAESWGEQNGVSSRDSLEYFSSLGLNMPFMDAIKTGHSGACSALSDEAVQSAKNIVESNDFQEHYQRALNSTASESANFMSDEGKRYAENYTASMDNLKSAQDQFSSAYSELNQISENLNYVESHTSTVNTNLNTEFSNWLNDRGALGKLFQPEKECELNALRDEFITEKCRSTIKGLENFKDPSISHKQTPDLGNEWLGAKERVKEKATDMDLSFGQAINSGQNVVNEYASKTEDISQSIDFQQQHVNSAYNETKSRYDNESQRASYGRLNERFLDNAKRADASLSSSWFESYANPK